MGLPVEINNLMLGSLGGYTVGRSLRFRSSASAYLNRTPASTGNRQKFTWSGWVKRGLLTTGTYYQLFGAGPTSGGNEGLFFDTTSGGLYFTPDATNAIVTSSVYRDPSAWYHIVLAVDTTQATATNREIIYVNGVQVTSYTGTYCAQNTNFNYINVASAQHRIGAHLSSGYYFDGYMAEVNFIDGQALTPSSFGAYDTNGVWQPKKYSGTYGTNGFYLPFSNTTSTTTLVQDSSGNGNNWTPNNISLTAGTTYDSMIDSPTNAAGTSTGIGNYAVLNPLDNFSSFPFTSADGNLKASSSTNNARCGRATFGVSSGKWYWEVVIDSAIYNTYYPSPGILPTSVAIPSQLGSSGSVATTGIAYMADGEKYSNGTLAAYGSSFTQNDIIGFALDMDAGTLVCYKNNVSQGTLVSGLSGSYSPSWNVYSSALNFNFGQRPFSYTPPSGFKALNTYNLPAPSIANGAQYMAATTYTGNGSTLAVSNGANNTIGTTFQPDFVWVKSRSNAYNNILQDSVRGAGKNLQSNTTNAETGNSGDLLTSFNSNGFTVNNTYLGGTDSSTDGSGATYVGWQWKAGGTGVTNTAGTITSTVSANPSAGFSIVSYAGNGAANATVGHGLGVAPQLYILKNRSAAASWGVLTTVINGSNQYSYLNSTQAFAAAGQASPTSTVLNLLSAGGETTIGNNYVAYCFSAVSGYSAFGKYTGNGSADGPFIYTGFRPRWVMIKNTQDGTTNWYIYDTSRDTYNIMSNYLMSNLSNAEASFSAMDYLSNGFKIRTSNLNFNNSGQTHIYAAFAESPFQISRAR